MNTNTTNNVTSKRFILSPPSNLLMSLRAIELVDSAATLHNKTDRLFELARFAYLDRDMATVVEIGNTLRGLPDVRLQQAGRYYIALSDSFNWTNLPATSKIFERTFDEGPNMFRARVSFALGQNYFQMGQPKEAMEFYRDSLALSFSKESPDFFTSFMALRGASILKGCVGDHKGAVNDLEKMLPLVRIISPKYPQLYYDWCNTLAVELAEIKCFDAAFQLIKKALSSPYANSNPAWRETFDDICRKMYRSPSCAINRLPLAVGDLALRRRLGKRHATSSRLESARGKVIHVANWIESQASEIAAGVSNLKAALRMTAFNEALKLIERCLDPCASESQLANLLFSLKSLNTGNQIG